jgi:hypothetical protein
MFFDLEVVMFDDLDNLYDMDDTEPNKRTTIKHIGEGLPVYDVNDKKVGTVKHFQGPSTAAYPELSEFPAELRSSAMPDELISRLLSAGFICVNAGFLAKDRFVFLYQIDYVIDEEVYLIASFDDLIKA